MSDFCFFFLLPELLYKLLSKVYTHCVAFVNFLLKIVLTVCFVMSDDFIAVTGSVLLSCRSVAGKRADLIEMYSSFR